MVKSDWGRGWRRGEGEGGREDAGCCCCCFDEDSERIIWKGKGKAGGECMWVA